MADETISIIIASLIIILGVLILITRFKGERVKNDPGNPSATSARIEIIILAIVMIIGGLIYLIREL